MAFVTGKEQKSGGSNSLLAISSTSLEQSSGADQVSQVMLQLDEVIQQNAASAEETASMSEELSAQAKKLLTMIDFFKIDASLHK